MRRRYSRVLNETGMTGLPDVVFVDGGAGQVGRAQTLFAELGLTIRTEPTTASAKNSFAGILSPVGIEA